LVILDVIDSAGAGASTVLNITRVAPGVLTANATGQGIAAATVLHVRADGLQTVENAAVYDADKGLWEPNPIDMGSDRDQVFLMLYGTGIRHRAAASSVTATVNGVSVPVQFSGAQPTYPGLDQVNLRLPYSLAGSGTVDVVVTVEGQAANTVTVAVR
jgi:uncharacterized protein (TIGR03437 family)